MMDLLKVLGTAVLLAYLGLVLVALLAAPKLIFPAPPPSYQPNSFPLRIPVPNAEPVVAVYAPTTEGAPLLLYFHGNGEDLGMLQERLQRFQVRGYAVLAIDYPGYGHSPGRPSEATILAAAEAALTYAQSELGVPPSRIFPYGTSLGSGPATALAARHSLGGLILESPFTSCFRVVTTRKLLPWDVFDNLARMPRVHTPILIFHGRLDQTIPFSHGERLLAAAPEGSSHLWLDDAHHLNVTEVGGPRYWEALARYLPTTPIP